MQEMWQLVHACYGDELGLTSDDEDYIPPANEEEKLSNINVRLSVESFSEVTLFIRTRKIIVSPFSVSYLVLVECNLFTDWLLLYVLGLFFYMCLQFLM
jgi:hypothetical protein